MAYRRGEIGSVAHASRVLDALRGFKRGRWVKGNFVTALLSSCVLGCHPQPAIKSFHVTPAAYCPSSTHSIEVDWSTEKGDATLQVAPDDPVPQKVSPSGKHSFPPHDMTITLRVEKGELAPHIVQPVRAVGQHQMSALVTVAGGGTCEGEWASADPTDFGGSDKAFDPHARMVIISNACGPRASEGATCRRDVKVEHGGKHWPIPAGGVLDLTAESVRVAGAWTISQHLLSGEVCGTPSAKAAVEVDLTAEMNCTEGVVHE